MVRGLVVNQNGIGKRDRSQLELQAGTGGPLALAISPSSDQSRVSGVAQVAYSVAALLLAILFYRARSPEASNDPTSPRPTDHSLRQEPAVSILSPPRSTQPTNTPLAPPRRDRRAGIAAALILAGGWGLLAGWWTPRGPITTLQALTAIAASLAVGALGGWLMRSRWAMLLTPVLFAAVFELTRAGTAGPLVDGIRLDGGGSFGLLAFILGRGLHAVLALVPMILGAALGAGLARRQTEGRPRIHGRARAGLVARRVTAAVAAVALLALTVGISRPASTDAILTDTGAPMAGSVAELIRVPVGAHDQAMMIRGTSTDNPVLLYLAGGPGGTELGAMRRHGQALEKDFIVVTWDQRGIGKSYDSLDPVSTLTLQQAVNDTVEVSNYLRDRFGQDKIYLFGQSYGTILGVLAAQQHPELYRAYIGVGQMVDPRATDVVFTPTPSPGPAGPATPHSSTSSPPAARRRTPTCSTTSRR